jgi:hypothetical protein
MTAARQTLATVIKGTAYRSPRSLSIPHPLGRASVIKNVVSIPSASTAAICVTTGPDVEVDPDASGSVGSSSDVVMVVVTSSARPAIEGSWATRPYSSQLAVPTSPSESVVRR